jgi:prolyl-tRNA editing enzyme YbaK/EbsC (Cys-tRNA(Pro) deacylase)
MEKTESSVLSSASVQRVEAALRAAGVAAEIVELPGAARTAKAAAEFLGCDAAQIANSLIFRGGASGAAILVMSSGARRIDTAKLASIVGEPIEKATADFVKVQTGFAIGGVAPVGHTGNVRRFVERSLGACEVVWAAAGHPNTVFRLSYGELVRITGGVEIDAAAA